MSNVGGYTTAEMLTQATYAGWDFANDWYMIEGNTRPFLRSEYSTVISSVNQLQLMALNVGASYRLLHDIDFGSLLTDDSRSDMWATSSSAGKGFLPGEPNITGRHGGSCVTDQYRPYVEGEPCDPLQWIEDWRPFFEARPDLKGWWWHELARAAARRGRTGFGRSSPSPAFPQHQGCGWR